LLIAKFETVRYRCRGKSTSTAPAWRRPLQMQRQRQQRPPRQRRPPKKKKQAAATNSTSTA